MKENTFDTKHAREMLQIAEVLKVIAHPTRLQILKLLTDAHSLTVTEIHDKLDCGCEQSMLSHHLVKMKDKGILESAKEGKFIHYSLVNKNLSKLLDCIEECKLNV